MLPGFNTNVEHRGMLFHLQSEDSGRAHPHILTHLYHGGTILASAKLDYAEHLEAADLPIVVRRLMEGQHRDLIARLGRGEFDGAIRERLGADAFAGETDPAAAGDVETAPLRTSPPAPAPGAAQRPSFGASAVGERPLDEVVLDYLIENARRRKARSS